MVNSRTFGTLLVLSLVGCVAGETAGPDETPDAATAQGIDARVQVTPPDARVVVNPGTADARVIPQGSPDAAPVQSLPDAPPAAFSMPPFTAFYTAVPGSDCPGLEGGGQACQFEVSPYGTVHPLCSTGRVGGYPAFTCSPPVTPESLDWLYTVPPLTGPACQSYQVVGWSGGYKVADTYKSCEFTRDLATDTIQIHCACGDVLDAGCNERIGDAPYCSATLVPASPILP